MGAKPRPNVLECAVGTPPQSPIDSRLIVPGVGLVRRGQVEPFLDTRPTLSSAHAQWSGITLESYTTPAVSIHQHEHPEHFLHLVLCGTAKYEVSTRGRNQRFTSRPGTIFLLPRGTEDEVHWAGPTHHMVLALHPRLLTEALDEAAQETDVELREHWNLIDAHISALLQELAADLSDRSPVGPAYGESLANTLAVSLLKRYAVRRRTPKVYKGGLPGYRLKRVLDYIADSLDTNISLSQLAAIAGMSPHYFSELFKQSTGRSPHSYVLLQRIERAKQSLRDPRRSVLDAGLDAGFQNASHFARMFRKLEGSSPSRFQADYASRATLTCLMTSRDI
jgi:AraC family transcriptional regulator